MFSSKRSFVTLDTVAMFVLDYRPWFNDKYFTLFNGKTHTITGETVGSFYQLTVPRLGLNFLRIYKDRVMLRVSAKILKQDYPLLISRETIERVIHEINQMGFVRLDVNKFLDAGILQRIDFTKDIYLQHGIKDHIAIMSRVQLVDPRFSVDRNEETKTGLVWNRRARTKGAKGRATIYGKMAELIHNHAQHKDITKYCPPSIFENVLRYEIRADCFSLIRSIGSLETKDPPILKDILSSNLNPCLKYFNKMFPRKVSSDRFDMSDNMTPKRAQEFYWLSHLLKKHESIDRAVSVHLQRWGGNVTRLRKQFRETEHTMKTPKQRNRESEVLDEIRNKLEF